MAQPDHPAHAHAAKAVARVRAPGARSLARTAAAGNQTPRLENLLWSDSTDSASAPDVLQTVALPVSHTPLDDRWRLVANTSAPNTPEVAAVVRQVRGQPRMEQLQVVNRWMNHRLEFASDQEVYGEADHWATLAESLPRGRGDCEDYAIGKMQLLRLAGVPASDMYLLIARDLVRRADHALLVVRAEGEYFVLDSSNDLILSDREVQDYQPLMSFSGDHSWLHGYRRAPVTMVATRAPGTPDQGAVPAAQVLQR